MDNVLIADPKTEAWVDSVVRRTFQKTNEDDLLTLTAHWDEQGWPWDIARFGKMITTPVYDGKYYYFPDWLDKTILTYEAEQRLNAAYKLGIEIQGVIIGHEVKKPPKKRLLEIDWAEVNRRAIEAAKIAGVAVATAGAVVAGATGLLISALLADPMLIVVLNDPANTNVEIFWWED